MRAHRLLTAQQRGLVVQCVARHRHEHRWDAQGVAVRVLQDVGRARNIPAGVAASLERAAQATRRETRRVRLSLDEGFAGELGQRLAVGNRLQEAVVLLGGQAGHRVEDVGVVGGALFQCPVLHRGRHRVGDRRVEFRALLDRRDHGFEDRLGQPHLHLCLREDIRSEDLARLLAGVEADCRRHIRLDVVDRLQAYRISAQLSSYHPRCVASDLLDVDRPTLGTIDGKLVTPPSTPQCDVSHPASDRVCAQHAGT